MGVDVGRPVEMLLGHVEVGMNGPRGFMVARGGKDAVYDQEDLSGYDDQPPILDI